jgi:DNA-nicking Smr family endonuclease
MNEDNNLLRVVGIDVGRKKIKHYDREIDFHGYYPEEAIYELEDILSLSHGELILVIHGYGDGVLRNQIRNFLKTTNLVSSWVPGELHNAPGLGGVTVVYT